MLIRPKRGVLSTNGRCNQGFCTGLTLATNASSGQFVLGHPRNRVNEKKKRRLPSVTELFQRLRRQV